MKDAPIILLDEATASVDPENEVLIQNAIRALVENKTLCERAGQWRLGQEQQDGCIVSQ